MKYIFIILILVACDTSDRNANVVKSTEKLDTVKTAAGAISSDPALFESAFIKGTKHKINKLTADLYGVTIGNIKIISGNIIACDPLHIDEYGIPFTQMFPKGEFPVQLSIARFKDEETIAFARIYFSDEPVVKWEFALQDGQKQIPIGEEDIHGYSVDAGIVILADKDAVKSMNLEQLTDTDTELYMAMRKHDHIGWRYTMYPFGTHNAAAFTTGFGDGHYGTYIGFDASGKPCRFLTDFGIFKWNKK